MADYETKVKNGQLYRLYAGGATGKRWLPATWKECLWCGDKFPRINSSGNSDKYCGRECYYKNLKKINAKKRIKKRCLVCGKPFAVSPSRAKSGIKNTTTCYEHRRMARAEAMKKGWRTRRSHEIQNKDR